ncbi:XkdF-like putative serine protease domain-containing protein [Pedobacter gandavensis]|uniref:XkdF-like putative serine protease domain-containing protein n=1 Tax=Pedobacter gandavensis TaxID=2679963 RepID=UPI002930545C|nr:XkdF-like putative serine protease domain-containing protein [Pedobacter gandavensis]
MVDKLKIYELGIDEFSDALVNAVALTGNPAHESLFLAFNSDKSTSISFSVDDDKKELIGAAMIPNIPIFRKANEVIKEDHYVKFSIEDIRKASMLFFKNGYQNNLNIEHTSTDAKAYIFQSYIIDTDKNMMSPIGLDLPNGTWVIGVKCDDEDVFKAVKELKAGFSVEGLFQYKFQNEEDGDNDVVSLIEEINTILKKIK